MDVRRIRYFIAVAEELSFSKAAQRLNISQPPLSQQIRLLEENLGARLLDRTSRRVELTEAGRSYLVYARAIFQMASHAKEEVAAINAGNFGRVDIGATGSILRGGLADLLMASKRINPGVITILHEQSPALQIKALTDRRTNLSFNRSIAKEANLVSELMWQEEVVAVLPKSHPLSRQPRIELGELQNDEHVILQPESSDFAMSLQKSCLEAGFLPRISQQIIDAQSIPSLIFAGFGVGLAPASIARFSSDDVVFMPIWPNPPKADVYIVYHKEEMSFAAKKFIASIREVIKTSRS